MVTGRERRPPVQHRKHRKSTRPEDNEIVSLLTRVRRRKVDEFTDPPACTYDLPPEMQWLDLRKERHVASLSEHMARDPSVLPSTYLREGYNPENPQYYWTDGLKDYLRLRWTVDTYGGGWDAVKNVFEIGCSTCRVLRHIDAQDPTKTAWGADIDRENVFWVREHLPRTLRVFQNSTFPKLPLPDASMDVVTAYSVFTHIDIWEDAWLTELRRVLRPGGIFLVTLQTENTWLKVPGRPETHGRLLRMETTPRIKLDEETFTNPMRQERVVFHFRGGGLGCNTYVKRSYVRKVWGRLFDVIGIFDAPLAPDGTDQLEAPGRRIAGPEQDVAVLRRPGGLHARNRRAGDDVRTLLRLIDQTQ